MKQKRLNARFARTAIAFHSRSEPPGASDSAVLERLIGEGGMGMVYAARHQDLGRHAAVKILHERFEASEEVRLRFLREAQTASRIRHPNIVDVYDVGADGGRAYLVMELLEGENLRRLIAREAPLSAQHCADLLLPAVAALAAAHDLGVVHRDLKPDNVFLSRGRSTLQPKVLDFGISKVADQDTDASLTGTGALLGTPYYMSPEQALSEKTIDARSDQYSVGVILYECLTGRRPIEESVLYRQIQRIVHGDFAAPRQLETKVPVAFEKIVLKAMARTPADRFSDMRALGRELLVFTSGRIRENYAQELVRDDPLEVRVPTQARSGSALELGTTLRESVCARENSGKSVKRRVPAVRLLVIVSLLSAVAGTLFWQISARKRLEISAASATNSGVPSGISIRRDPAAKQPTPVLAAQTRLSPLPVAPSGIIPAPASARAVLPPSQGPSSGAPEKSPLSVSQGAPSRKASTAPSPEAPTQGAQSPDPYADQK